MSQHRRRLDNILSDDFIDDISHVAMSDVRERRDMALGEETELSFVRRILQAKLDLLKAELRVRKGEAPSLIESLPEVLADDGPRPTYGRLPRTMAPGEHPWGRRPGDELITDDTLSRLDGSSDDEIRELIEAIEAQEHEVSDVRQRLFDVIDKFQAEITRRYASGEASVDELLTGR